MIAFSWFHDVPGTTYRYLQERYHVVKPDISHSTRDSVAFVDGTELQEVDSTLLATGYGPSKP